jgi:hypothetical protein
MIVTLVSSIVIQWSRGHAATGSRMACESSDRICIWRKPDAAFLR